LANQNGFWPNVEIGQKMTNGQLLFLALTYLIGSPVCPPTFTLFLHQTQVHRLKAQMEKMEDAENEVSSTKIENETVRRWVKYFMKPGKYFLIMLTYCNGQK